MSYNKKTWVSKETITKEALNNIEEGIATLDKNQENFATKEEIPSVEGLATEEYINEEIAKIDVTNQLTDYAKKTDIPTKTSELTNDSGFLTSIPSEYITETEWNSISTLTLGVHTDGLIYIFMNGKPIGIGIETTQTVSGDITGYIDENNIIILTSELADGTYTIKYENEDGTYTEIGEFDVGEVVKYTNVFDSSKATINVRLNSSATTSSLDGYVVSDYIPITLSADNPVVLRVRGASFDAENASIAYYYGNYAVIYATLSGNYGASIKRNGTAVYKDENNDEYIKPGYVNTVSDDDSTSAYDSVLDSTIYIRITLKVSDSVITAEDITNIIVTINEPIVD